MEKALAGRHDSSHCSSSEDGESGAAGATCPLCMNGYDETDLSFEPCVCKYRICLWCVHRLFTDNKGCPACRRPYVSTLFDATPRQLLKKEPRKVSNSRPCQRRLRASSSPPSAALAKRETSAKIDNLTEDPWANGADPWSQREAVGVCTSSAASRSSPKKAGRSREVDWWSEHVASMSEAVAPPWLPPSQGKASRDLFDSGGWSAGLNTRALNLLGPSRGDDFESWLQKRKTVKAKSAVHASAGHSQKIHQPAVVSSPRTEKSARTDVDEGSKPRHDDRPVSYAGALLGIHGRSQQVEADHDPDTDVGLMTMEGPGAGFFVLKKRRGPAIPEGFGPGAAPRHAPQIDSTAVLGAQHPVNEATASEADAGLRIRSRLALQEAIRTSDIETVRRRLANAEAVGVSKILLASARGRLEELMGTCPEAADLQMEESVRSSYEHATRSAQEEVTCKQSGSEEDQAARSDWGSCSDSNTWNAWKWGSADMWWKGWGEPTKWSGSSW